MGSSNLQQEVQPQIHSQVVQKTNNLHQESEQKGHTSHIVSSPNKNEQIGSSFHQDTQKREGAVSGIKSEQKNGVSGVEASEHKYNGQGGNEQGQSYASMIS